MRYACIDRSRDHYPVRMMCRLLRVSPSGYYAWRRRPESSRITSDRHLMAEIRRVHQDSNGVYGSPRVHAELIANGVSVGRHKVARLMRLARLRGCPKRRFRVTTQRDPSHLVAKNLLKQDFAADAPNKRWAADITYIPTHQGWLYLAVVMDLYSRRIVGWSMSRWLSRRIVLAALRMAINARQPEGPLIHHSDRGGQYTSGDFRNELARHGIDCSMSSSGNCYPSQRCKHRLPGNGQRRRREFFLGCSNVNVSTGSAIAREKRRVQTCSNILKYSTIENDAMVTLAT